MAAATRAGGYGQKRDGRCPPDLSLESDIPVVAGFAKLAASASDQLLDGRKRRRAGRASREVVSTSENSGQGTDCDGRLHLISDEWPRRHGARDPLAFPRIHPNR